VRSFRVLEYIRSADGVWNLPASHVDGLRSEFPDLEFVSPADEAEIERLLPGAEVVLGFAVTSSNFGSASRLRWIQSTAAGVGSFLFPALVESDVVLTNGRGIHAVSMAEHALGVILSFVRNLHLARDLQRERRWLQYELWTGPPALGELAGRTLGIVGLGAVGSAIASRARALGLEVIGLRRHPAPDPAPADAQWGLERLAELVARADFLVLAAPLTGETRGMIGRDLLRGMKPGAVLVNLGRGKLVDEDALIEALREGRIGGAALDVFRDEPLPATSPLWAMPQVLVTPHVSGLGPRYWERSVALFSRNLRAYRSGSPLENVVDKRAGY
jgi:phosphoglycerate dehydrogenase-like enzyme